MSEAGPAPGTIERLRLYYSKNEQRIAVLSFICGFLKHSEVKSQPAFFSV